jgi:hypothetical protein
LVYSASKFLNHIIFTVVLSLALYKSSIYILLIIAILSFSKYRSIIASILVLFATISEVFEAFYAREIEYHDIYLLLYHIDETFETLFEIINIAIYPSIKLVAIFIFLYIYHKRYFIDIRFSTHIFILLILLFSHLSSAFNLLYQILHATIDIPTKIYTKNLEESKNIYPIKDSHKNIVLIFGESLRYDRYKSSSFHEQYIKDDNYSFTKAISLATNTDVVLPLFLNSSYDLDTLNSDKNLFKLAKRAKYSTYFYSTQYDNALRHIKPYIDIDSIDYYANGTKSSLDSFLLDSIQEIDFSKKSFVVLQMYGEHSPYKRYPKEYAKNIAKYDTLLSQVDTDYNNSLLYTQYILNSIIEYIKRQSTKETLVIFVSDHGELLGEDSIYGHNRFHKDIYEVPAFIYSINHKHKLSKDRVYQLDLANIILDSLGYNQVKVPYPYRVNGTMITAEDGYIEVK